MNEVMNVCLQSVQECNTFPVLYDVQIVSMEPACQYCPASMAREPVLSSKRATELRLCLLVMLSALPSRLVSAALVL